MIEKSDIPERDEEFDLYCQGKPMDARQRLASVCGLILDPVPEVSEGRSTSTSSTISVELQAQVWSMRRRSSRGQASCYGPTIPPREELSNTGSLTRLDA